MNSFLTNYQRVWVLDTEFRAAPGERNTPVCLCARDLKAGEEIEVFFDRNHENPFSYDDALFVAYHAAAEWKTFISLGWDLPTHIIDLSFEYLRLINGVWRGNTNLRQLGTGLLHAMQEFNLDSISCAEKEEERDYILTHEAYPPEGQRRILNYCWRDVDGTSLLLQAMLPLIDDPAQALLRGAYSRAVAWMEHNGLPIDRQYQEIEQRRVELQLAVIREIEDKYGYGVYRIVGRKSPRPVFSQKGFDALIEREGLLATWPKMTERGHCSTDDDQAFKPMANLHPQLEPLRQLRKTVRGLTLVSDAIGADSRNRAPVWPFGTVTGRNSPRARESILNRPRWVRNLIAPPYGRAVVGFDIEAAETAIAADLSCDPELLRIYNSGADQYIEFAISSGALSPGTKRNPNDPKLEAVRDLYKIAALAIQYGVAASTLALNLGKPYWQADRIIAAHKKTYATYWAWAEAQIAQAYAHRIISTAFGWTMAVDNYTPRNRILNFPQQATCAELLRLTCILAEERGMGHMLCAPHHDALYVECQEQKVKDVMKQITACFADAAEVVLSGRVCLRVKPHIVVYPDRYADEKGASIWDAIQSHLSPNAPIRNWQQEQAVGRPGITDHRHMTCRKSKPTSMTVPGDHHVQAECRRRSGEHEECEQVSS